MKKFIFLLVFVFCLGLFGNVVADISSGLVAHYSFDGNSNDSSGNEHHGTENGGISYVTGHSGLAASFDGVNDYINIGNGELVAQDNISISAWVNPSSIAGNQHTIFTQNDTSTGRVTHQLRINGENHQNTTLGSLHYDNWLPSSGYTASNGIVSISKWYHVAVTRDGTTVKLYINGQLDTEGVGENRESSSTIDNTLIGARYYNGSPQLGFEGLIDELRVYNRALSSSEIQQIYIGTPSCTSAEAGTVSSNLDIHMPSLDYQTLFGTQNIWVDFEYSHEENGKLYWSLKDYGANN